METPLNSIRRLEQRGHWGIKRGLANPQALLEGLGRPDLGYPVVLLAGTNGKGSTGAFLAHALRASGMRVGWTTSPHLVHPRERIWVDGQAIGEAVLDRLLEEAFAAETRLGLQATYFELMITAALLAFRTAQVEVALVEVGMGGRWDATNALDPVLTVLTNVGLDHVHYLGGTRELIGREKLCTARQGRPLVLGPGLHPAWVWPLLETRPELCPAPRLPIERVAWDHSLAGGYRLGLGGRHQVENAATALEALRHLRRMGFPIQPEAVHSGLAATRWPGRLWSVPGLQEVWMDGAHNPDGAWALAGHARACGVRPHLFFGAMGDKDLSGMVDSLKGMDPHSVTLVLGDNERYASAQALQSAWGSELEVLDLDTAAARLRQEASAPRLVTGSLFLLGDLLRTLEIDPSTHLGPEGGR